MKNIQHTALVLLALIVAACQPATPPPPLTVNEGEEFTLAPGQSATINASALTVELVGVAGDERCPSEIECAMSGPVSISLTMQQVGKEAVNINLQTFTDTNGRAPGMEFEGIQDRIEYEGYLIRVTGVLPYPLTLKDEIKDNEYRVTLVASEK